jgi:hypothetical protein
MNKQIREKSFYISEPGKIGASARPSRFKALEFLNSTERGCKIYQRSFVQDFEPGFMVKT